MASAPKCFKFRRAAENALKYYARNSGTIYKRDVIRQPNTGAYSPYDAPVYIQRTISEFKDDPASRDTAFSVIDSDRPSDRIGYTGYDPYQVNDGYFMPDDAYKSRVKDNTNGYNNAVDAFNKAAKMLSKVHLKSFGKQ